MLAFYFLIPRDWKMFFFFTPTINLTNKPAVLCVIAMSRPEPCRRFNIYFPLPNFSSSMRASRHAAGARVSGPRVCGAGASLFQPTVGSTPGSVSMPARAPAERSSHILQLGPCHQRAPGPKPHETECIFNTEKYICVASSSSDKLVRMMPGGDFLHL